MVADLLEAVPARAIMGDVAAIGVTAVEYDSRRVEPGALFCCLRGEMTDGHLHAAEAVSRGATCLLCDHFLDLGVAQVEVLPEALRPAMAEMAAAFHGYPARSLDMVGVTGTNGKTTVTHLVRSILEVDGRQTGVVGTLGGVRTTPESPDLQRALAGLIASGCTAAAIEVSSHALTQHRVDGLVFDVAAFTNLSRDHLDHHGTMDSYFEAKASLFTADRCRHAVVFADDVWGARLLDEIVGVGVTRVQRSDAQRVQLSVGVSRFTWRGREVELPLSGQFNVDNALMAAGIASALDVDDASVVEGLNAAPPVPGRMEVVGRGAPISVLVDFAHTPAGLSVALDAARTLATGKRLICVFGCGGDRDAGKRPQMGAVATEGADVVVITSDNPRSEDPDAIIEAIRSGTAADADAAVQVEPDRAAAIRAAIAAADPGDVVLIAGKGHEVTQTIRGGAASFDDRVEAQRALDERFGTPDR